MDTLQARLLIVEDNQSNIDLLEGILRREGYPNVKSLSDSRLVESTFLEWRPDVILLDLMMPYLDGFEVIAILKTLVPTDDFVPIIMLTADLRPRTKQRALEAGASDFVTKPFDVVEVALRIRNQLRVRALHVQLQRSNIVLEEKVRERTAELRASEERLREIAETIDEVFWSADIHTTKNFYISRAYERIWGSPIESLKKNPLSFTEAIHPQDRSRVLAHLKVKETCQPFSNEYRIIRPDGSVRWISDSGYPVRNSDGSVDRYVGIAQDITGRKIAEERNLALITALGEIIYEWVPSANSVVWEGDYTRVLGYTLEELGNSTASWENRIHPEERDRVAAEVENARLHRRMFDLEYRFKHKNGSYLWMHDRGVLTFDADGAIERMIGVFRDVTERKTVEQRLIRAQRLESIGALASGIAHDLNNVLAPIMLTLNVFRKKLTDGQSQRSLDMMDACLNRGANLIKQVLTFARGTEGCRTAISLRYITDEIKSVAEETFSKAIQFRTNVPKELPLVVVDPTQVHQVLMNLCVNARDAMPAGGRIDIGAEIVVVGGGDILPHPEAQPGKYIRLSVADKGTGISADVMEKIFHPFFTTKEITKGTGLGLATVQTIMKSHGGFVTVKSQVGKGTTFNVFFPVQEVVQDAATESPAAPPSGNGELILVVDDEASIREITKETLTARGYSVILAADGPEAVAQYATHRSNVALVFTDVMMPFMDGYATARAIRKMDPGARFLLASGLEPREPSADDPPVEFVRKPYTAEALMTAIGGILHP